MRPVIDELLDRDRAARPRRSRRVDVTSQYPVQVICGIVGVPLEDAAQFAQWAEEINTGPLRPDRGHGRVAGDGRLPRAAGRGAPREPDRRLPLAISCTPRSTASGSPTSKIYGFLRLLLPAGAETTFRVMGNALYALLDAPRRPRHASSPIPTAAPRGDRGDAALGDVGDDGQPGRDARHRGRAGARSPRARRSACSPGRPTATTDRWDDADEWKLGRPVQHHLAFGTGPHQCLGMHLARLELRVGLDAILEPAAEPAPRPRTHPRAVIEGYAFRGPDALPCSSTRRRAGLSRFAEGERVAGGQAPNIISHCSMVGRRNT